MFNIDQALDQERSGFPGLELDFTTNPRSYENFELSINAVQVEGRLRLETQYNTDLFDAATVRRWLSAFECLLRKACEAPDEPIARLPLVDCALFAELAALQPAPTPFDRECRMHELFERQCDREPSRLALSAPDGCLDYAALEARANRIARLLRGHGVQKGARSVWPWTAYRYAALWASSPAPATCRRPRLPRGPPGLHGRDAG